MVTENDKKLGRHIQKFRKKAKLTQEELANKVNLSTKYIQFIETAHRRPSLKTLHKVAKALNIKIKDLF